MFGRRKAGLWKPLFAALVAFTSRQFAAVGGSSSAVITTTAARSYITEFGYITEA